MSKLLTALKLSNAVKPNLQSVAALRRNKLASKVEEQILLAEAQRDGRLLSLTKSRTFKDKATGAIQRLEVPKRVNKWWFNTDEGVIAINIRYGSKVLELAKGKTAVEVADTEELLNALNTIKAAVVAGELDGQIDAASAQIRQRFA